MLSPGKRKFIPETLHKIPRAVYYIVYGKKGDSGMISVAAALVIKNGRVLASSRPADRSYSGRWEFPGGKAESGETLEEALKREMLEELDMPIAVDRRFRSIAVSEKLTVTFFLCRPESGSEPNAREHQPRCWADPAELRTLDFLDADRPVAAELADLLEKQTLR